MNGESKYPLISVIVPIYNVRDYLEKCVDSLLDQDFDSFEIVLVNDCSTDDSPVIAKTYADNHPERCVLVNHMINGGLSAARNTGLKASRGDWVSFVDSDDWVSSDYLSGMYDSAVRDNADVVIGGVAYAYDDGTTKSADSYGNLKNGADKKDIVAQCRSYACGRLFNKSLFEEIAFPEDIRRSEDIGTIIPILTKANRISILEKEVYFYYQRSSSLSLSNKDIDLSFYPRTVSRMLELSEEGFEKELEFRCVHELLYGMVYLMILSGKSREEFMTHVNAFNETHIGWENNPYISELPKAKQLFIKLAGNKQFGMLKLLVFARGLMSRG